MVDDAWCIDVDRHPTYHDGQELTKAELWLVQEHKFKPKIGLMDMYHP